MRNFTVQNGRDVDAVGACQIASGFNEEADIGVLKMKFPDGLAGFRAEGLDI